MADEDPVDPKPDIEESCKPKCVKQLLQYQTNIGFKGKFTQSLQFVHLKFVTLPTLSPLLQTQACVKRVDADTTGQKHCTGQYFDYWSCIDKCAAPKLFAKLK